jgi:type I restriction enzyme S subunit
MINLKCFDRNGGFRQDGIKYYAGDFKERHEVLYGDLMIAMTDLTQDRAVLGLPILCPEINTKSKVIASLDIGILKQIAYQDLNLNLYFNYTMRSNQYHQYILGYGNGSTVMHLDKKGVLEYEALLPAREVLIEFNNVVSTYQIMRTNNQKEIETLTTLRNTLLPKLISGEVRLKEFEEEITTAL